jgi:glycosyltransferase involved in cell wall biosynthesis
MSLLPFLIQGPGSHSELIEQYLDKNFQSWDSLNYWPKFSFTKVRKGKKDQHSDKLYDFITFIIYAINNRLSGFTHNQQLHKEFLNFYYDQLCSSRLTEAKALIAWTMVSLNTIKKNKRLGGKTILEHGMAHVDYWMSENQKFYRDSTFVVKPGYSSFTKGMIERMKKEYELADYIQVHSSFAKKTFLENNIPCSKLLVCELGINPGYFSNSISLAKRKKFTLLYVGRLELLKGVHLLLEVVSKFRSDEIDLILVGRVMPEIKPFLDKFSNDNLKVIGSLDKRQISAYYQQADILVFPTLNDAFGMVMLEAMIHGLPVIGSMASAAPDIITNEVNGLVIKSGDTSSLEEAIKWAVNNRSKLVKMGADAKMLVGKKYLASHYFERLQDNLKQINFLP